MSDGTFLSPDKEAVPRSLADAYAKLYEQLEDTLFPRRRTAAESFAVILRMLGAVAIGSVCASFTLLAIFILLNMVFHFAPA